MSSSSDELDALRASVTRAAGEVRTLKAAGAAPEVLRAALASLASLRAALEAAGERRAARGARCLLSPLPLPSGARSVGRPLAAAFSTPLCVPPSSNSTRRRRAGEQVARGQARAGRLRAAPHVCRSGV